MLAAALALALLAAPAAAASAPPPAPDYASASAWACRPDAPGACAGDLGAMKVDVSGPRQPDPFVAAADAPVDCFYVYPTTSQQPQDYARAEREPSVDHTVRVQAARLSARCRVFAPLYRQLTSAGLDRQLKGGAAALNFDSAYDDVKAAWRRYLANDNRGRGVVLVGHSQGSILLARLLKEEIEGRPEHRLIVSAILAGHPAVLTPPGRDVGGTFRETPLCRSKAQAGCVVAWSTYPVAEAAGASAHIFARDQGGLVAACVNPAAPGSPGGAPLHPVFSRPSIAPVTDPPFVEPVGQVSGGCAADGGGHVLKVKVEPGPYASLVQTLFDRYDQHGGWGLHALDVQMVEDDIADLIGAQSAAWTSSRR